MEKRKPTIDEIYKLNVDGLFESTANWFDNAFKKSQAEINRDLYNKINGYSSSSESTGGNVSLGPLLNSLNDSNLYPSRGYLYYNGNDWEFNTPTISGGEGGVVDTAAITKIVNDTIKNISWWGQNINNNKVDGNIVITKGSHSFTIELDDNGNLKFNGNIYATGGITALGVGSTPGSGSGVSLGTLLTKLNSDNPFPTDNGQVLTYDGSNFIWKIPTGSAGGSGSGGSTTGTLYFGASNKNLGFNGSNDMSLAFGDGLKVEKLDNQITVSAIGGGIGGGSIQVTDVSDSGESNNWISATKLRFRSIAGTKPTIREIPSEGYVDVGIPTGSGSGSSSRINKIKLFNSAGESFETVSLGTADTIGFMAGNNVSLEAVVKEYTNVIKISATGGSGGSSGSTSTSVSWENVTNKPSTFTPKSHTHSTSDISGLSSYVQGVKVSNATNADKLANSRTIWGQSFNGTSNINGNLKMGSAGGGSIQLWMNNDNMLERINNTLHIAYGLKESSNGEIDLNAYRTVVYTDNMSKHYDFKSNVFDVNSNQIHFGTDSNGGTLSWDSANKCFKIDGSVYATGGITALGVSNNATTSNNVDFTFKSVTANTFNVMNSIQLSDNLKLTRDGNDINLVNTDSVNEHWLYINSDGLYGLSSDGNVYVNHLECDAFSFGQADNFEIVDANDRSFTIQFIFAGKTYRFTPSGNSVTVS